MDREIFSQPETLARLKNWQLVRADLTDNTPASRDLLKRFQLFGPPALLFFQSGQEITEARVVGEMTLDGFKQHLQQHPMEAIP